MIVIADLMMNFSILFTLTLLMFFFAQKERFLLFPSLKRFQPFTIGLIGGFYGVVLMIEHIHAFTAVIMDARYAAIVFSGMFGGPIGVLITTSLISGFRYFYFDMTVEALVAALNTLVFGYITALLLIKYPMTMKNSLLYYSYGIIQTAIVIFFYNLSSPGAFQDLLVFLTFSIISYAVVWFTLHKMNRLAKEVEKIEELAETDYLTGLSNNRKYQQIFYEWRDRKPEFHMAVIDIDHFKRVNDTYGHPIGDVVLKELAHRLEATATTFGARVSRIGGEEFGALLPASRREEAKRQAEMLRHVISSAPFQIDDHLALPITVSIGVAHYPSDAQSMPDLYKVADEKLYDAKLGGRNQVHITKEPQKELVRS